MIKSFFTILFSTFVFTLLYFLLLRRRRERIVTRFEVETQSSLQFPDFVLRSQKADPSAAQFFNKYECRVGNLLNQPAGQNCSHLLGFGEDESGDYTELTFKNDGTAITTDVDQYLFISISYAFDSDQTLSWWGGIYPPILTIEFEPPAADNSAAALLHGTKREITAGLNFIDISKTTVHPLHNSEYTYWNHSTVSNTASSELTPCHRPWINVNSSVIVDYTVGLSGVSRPCVSPLAIRFLTMSSTKIVEENLDSPYDDASDFFALWAVVAIVVEIVLAIWPLIITKLRHRSGSSPRAIPLEDSGSRDIELAELTKTNLTETHEVTPDRVSEQSSRSDDGDAGEPSRYGALEQ